MLFRRLVRALRVLAACVSVLAGFGACACFVEGVLFEVEVTPQSALACGEQGDDRQVADPGEDAGDRSEDDDDVRPDVFVEERGRPPAVRVFAARRRLDLGSRSGHERKLDRPPTA